MARFTVMQHEVNAGNLAPPSKAIDLGDGRYLRIQEWHPHVVVGEPMAVTIIGLLEADDEVVAQ